MVGPSFDAIVLAGGTGRRMNGTDKTALTVAGASLLDRVLVAVADARSVVVVGDPRPTPRPVSWTREQPVGTGPAAATRAGLDLVDSELTVLLAADLPFLTRSTVERLCASAGPSGAVLLDGLGEEQWLSSAWPSALLRSAELRSGGSLRAALAPMHPVRIPATDNESFDCDTPDDLARARELA